MQLISFPAWRPPRGLAGRIAAPPYDVVEAGEARRIADGEPMCFLRVTRPDIQFPPDTVPAAEEVYARARDTFQEFLRRGWLVEDPAPGVYLYRQIQGGHEQTGLVALASVEEYEQGVIRRHEHTRPDTETDRARHIEAIGAQPGPVMLAVREHPDLAGLWDPPPDEPLADVTAADGVRHLVWRHPDPDGVRVRFRAVEAAYIADGHHRVAAAARADRRRRGSDGAPGGFLATIFPAGALRICGYHRCFADLNGLSPESFLDTVRGLFRVEPDPDPAPPARGEALLWVRGGAFRLGWPPPRGPREATLDVQFLQDRLFGPVLGVADPRRDPRMSFVGGLDGSREVRRRVERGEAAAGTVFAPVAFDDVMAISDAGAVMPPKSTWFEPKLRSGLLVHVLDRAGGA